MSEQTKIAWCDSTVNFWEGCTKVSVGCANCYAATRDNRFTGGKLWGKGAPRRKSKSAVKDALAFNRKPWICDYCGEAYPDIIGCSCSDFPVSNHRRRIFSLSLGDWLDDEVPIEWLAEMLDTIRQCDQVTWILCSKRWENFEKRISDVVAYDCANRGNEPVNGKNLSTWLINWINDPYQNIIGLCSVENQETADSRIPQFLTVPLACRGLSMEPLLGAVDLTRLCADESMGCTFNALTGFGDWNKDQQAKPIDWLIIGGESGTNARPCDVDWIRSIVAQGKAAGVATFMKQVGSNPVRGAGDEPFERIKHIRKYGYDHHEAVPYDKKGADPSEWPQDLRIQEFPKL